MENMKDLTSFTLHQKMAQWFRLRKQQQPTREKGSPNLQLWDSCPAPTPCGGWWRPKQSWEGSECSTIVPSGAETVQLNTEVAPRLHDREQSGSTEASCPSATRASDEAAFARARCSPRTRARVSRMPRRQQSLPPELDSVPPADRRMTLGVLSARRVAAVFNTGASRFTHSADKRIAMESMHQPSAETVSESSGPWAVGP
ncbi:hypothetical protein EYF80_016354 [Liparis tanakae]|uniref:Uncharacterized protein n=1 Tax=Liparis tanakae TaxID=230148 RepID=A0A4Z2I6G1_9TELE|nr:hypothetical protein EYF80_016354 [Liparis tanakae]